MQKWNSSKCPNFLSEVILIVIPYTNHCLCSSFSSKSWSWRFIKSSDSMFSQFSHLKIFVHFSLPVSIPFIFATTNISTIDSGADSNFVITASYSCILVFYFRPHCSENRQQWMHMCWLPIQGCVVWTQNLCMQCAIRGWHFLWIGLVLRR